MAFPAFKLSRELLGHSQDVRSVAVLPSGHIATGSRDTTVKIWDPSNPASSRTLTAHQGFVGAITALNPHADAPSRIFASGGHDKVICVWDVAADNLTTSTNNNNNNNNNNSNTNTTTTTSADKDMDDGNPVLNFMMGHENAVSTLSATVDGDIISGSWDKTAKIWQFGTVAQELKGHEHAVWAVLGLPNGDVVTGSADSSIKIWRGPVGSMKCIKTMKEHKDCVRGLALIPGIGFVSCSNDETLIVWSMSGDPLQVLLGHQGFIYTVDVLRKEKEEYLIVSGSEDRTVRVWKDGEIVQTITHPSGVWSVAAAHDTGDIVSGCADGVARIWSQDATRIAEPEVLQTYEANVASSSVHKSSVGDLNMDKLPGTDALLTKTGTKDGEHLIVKTSGGGAELHSWSMAEGRWVKIGDVVDSAGGNSKQSLYGKEYDYVFDIDVGDGVMKQLGYNSGDNPYLVAQEFLWREEMDQHFLDQVAQFIVKNANVSPMTIGGPAPASDPYTGGSRYIPGTSGAAASETRRPAASSDPFTGNNRYVPYSTPAATPTPSNPAVSNSYFPQKTMTAYDGGNLDGLLKKLGEFAADAQPALTPEDQTQINNLITVLKDTARYHSTRVTEDQIRIVIKKLLAWPSEKLLPVLDLIRLLFTHTHAAEILGVVKTTPSLYEILYNIASTITVPTNAMLALRSFANMFKIAGARSRLIEANQPAIMDLLLITVGSDNKNVTHASSTILLNFAVLYKSEPNDDLIARAIAVLAKAFANPTLQPDVALRYVIAAGTLASMGGATFNLLRTHITGLLPALSSSTDKDLGPAARVLAQSLV